MSRFSVRISEDQSFNFGCDHAMGYFYDIYDEVNDTIIEEKSTLFNRLTGFELAEQFKRTVPNTKHQLFQKQLSAMYLDIQF